MATDSDRAEPALRPRRDRHQTGGGRRPAFLQCAMDAPKAWPSSQAGEWMADGQRRTLSLTMLVNDSVTKERSARELTSAAMSCCTTSGALARNVSSGLPSMGNDMSINVTRGTMLAADTSPVDLSSETVGENANSSATPPPLSVL